MCVPELCFRTNKSVFWLYPGSDTFYCYDCLFLKLFLPIRLQSYKKCSSYHQILEKK